MNTLSMDLSSSSSMEPRTSLRSSSSCSRRVLEGRATCSCHCLPDLYSSIEVLCRAGTKQHYGSGEMGQLMAQMHMRVRALAPASQLAEPR